MSAARDRDPFSEGNLDDSRADYDNYQWRMVRRHYYSVEYRCVAIEWAFDYSVVTIVERSESNWKYELQFRIESELNRGNSEIS